VIAESQAPIVGFITESLLGCAGQITPPIMLTAEDVDMVVRAFDDELGAVEKG